MLHIDNQFIKTIRVKSKKNISFIDEVAAILEVNYDAAYRRINGKTKLTLEDAVKLSKYYKVSLNKLFTVGDESKMIVTKTTEIYNIKSLELYFKMVHERLKPIELNDKSKMYYSAKELPVFHLLKNTLLFKFKVYVWLQILGENAHTKKVPFKDYKIPNSLIETIVEVGKQYKRTKIIEIWGPNIISAILLQIKYFYESGLLISETALNICNELRETIKQIEDATYTGKRSNINKTNFKLFYNPILNSNNNILISVPNYKVVFLSYSILHYYEIEDPKACSNMEQYLKDQMFLSKQITESGVKDIILFFKPLYRQIDSLIKQINLQKQFPIQKF